MRILGWMGGCLHLQCPPQQGGYGALDHPQPDLALGATTSQPPAGKGDDLGRRLVVVQGGGEREDVMVRGCGEKCMYTD